MGGRAIHASLQRIYFLLKDDNDENYGRQRMILKKLKWNMGRKIQKPKMSLGDPASIVRRVFSVHICISLRSAFVTFNI